MSSPDVTLVESATIVATYLAMLACFIYSFSLKPDPGPASAVSFERKRKRLNFYFHIYWIFGVGLMVYLVGVLIELMGD